MTPAERSALGCYEITAPRLFRGRDPRRLDPRLRMELDSEEISYRVLVGQAPGTWRTAWMDGLGWGRYRLAGDTLSITFGEPDRYGLTFLVRPEADSTRATATGWQAFNPAFTRTVTVLSRRASCDELFGI